jgi:hypothetical protein
MAWAEEPKPIAKQRVISVLNVDLNDDGWADRVVLYEQEDEDAAVDFFIRETENYTLAYAATLAEPIWSGLMSGTIPSLGVNDAGSLLIKSENIAIGRSRWEQILTIAYRQNALRVVGFTYKWYDTLNLEDNGQCDINLLSGKAVLEINGASDTWSDLEFDDTLVENWLAESISDICFADD